MTSMIWSVQRSRMYVRLWHTLQIMASSTYIWRLPYNLIPKCCEQIYNYIFVKFSYNILLTPLPLFPPSASNCFWRCFIKKLFLKTLQYSQDESSWWWVFCEKIYQYVDIMWLLLTRKHMCWSLFLILSIAKLFRALILKNICKRLLLKIRL